MSEDAHWNSRNSIYGDNPVKINEREDPLGLDTYTYKPDINAIMQSGNLYAHCINNPIRYIDASGNLAAEATVAATNWWNPIGWIAAVIVVVEVIVVAVAITETIDETNNNRNIAYGKKTSPPSKLKDGDKIKTPETHPDEFQKNRDGSYTHKKTGWKAEKSKSSGTAQQHYGEQHWHVSPPNGETGDYYNVDKNGEIMGG